MGRFWLPTCGHVCDQNGVLSMLCEGFAKTEAEIEREGG